MRSPSLRLTLVSAVLAAAGTIAAGPDHGDTRLVARPGISASNIAFVYADDIWVADLDGRDARRVFDDRVKYDGVEGRGPLVLIEGRSPPVGRIAGDH